MNLNGTSQDCSNCGEKVLKNLSDRIHYCPSEWHCDVSR
ncbi:MAG: zinc ribbon domain-containing protein [Trichodesmium sp. MO_231.B1]|nr:zinc ribbon domain-containing protein [Trichodesmium sp. MO_231.B1]